METYNTIDEKMRFCKVKHLISRKDGQYDTHTYSYLHAREQYKSIGYMMGLDKLLYHANVK